MSVDCAMRRVVFTCGAPGDVHTSDITDRSRFRANSTPNTWQWDDNNASWAVKFAFAQDADKFAEEFRTSASELVTTAVTSAADATAAPAPAAEGRPPPSTPARGPCQESSDEESPEPAPDASGTVSSCAAEATERYSIASEGGDVESSTAHQLLVLSTKVAEEVDALALDARARSAMDDLVDHEAQEIVRLCTRPAVRNRNRYVFTAAKRALKKREQLAQEEEVAQEANHQEADHQEADQEWQGDDTGGGLNAITEADGGASSASESQSDAGSDESPAPSTEDGF